MFCSISNAISVNSSKLKQWWSRSVWSEILIGGFLESDIDLNMDQQDRRPQLFHPSSASQINSTLPWLRSYTWPGVSFRDNQAFVNYVLAGLLQATIDPSQQAAVRLVAGTGIRDPITPVFISLHWLSIKLYTDYKPCLCIQYGQPYETPNERKGIYTTVYWIYAT